MFVYIDRYALNLYVRKNNRVGLWFGYKGEMLWNKTNFYYYLTNVLGSSEIKNI